MMNTTTAINQPQCPGPHKKVPTYRDKTNAEMLEYAHEKGSSITFDYCSSKYERLPCYECKTKSTITKVFASPPGKSGKKYGDIAHYLCYNCKSYCSQYENWILIEGTMYWAPDTISSEQPLLNPNEDVMAYDTPEELRPTLADYNLKVPVNAGSVFDPRTPYTEDEIVEGEKYRNVLRKIQ